MKKILILGLAAFSLSAFAGEGPSRPQGAATMQQQQQQSNSTSSAGSNNEGNNQSVTLAPTIVVGDTGGGSRDTTTTARVYTETSGTTTLKNVPSMVGPALVSSNDTCMGSVSAAGAGAGFGLSIGTTYKDDNCVMLKNSRELWNMGMKAAALALMCTDKANKDALELTGFECPQTTAAKKAEADKAAAAKTAAAPSGKAEKLASAYEGNDPIVQARLGLTK